MAHQIRGGGLLQRWAGAEAPQREGSCGRCTGHLSPGPRTGASLLPALPQDLPVAFSLYALKGTPGGSNRYQQKKTGAPWRVLEKEGFALPWPPWPVSESPQDSSKSSHQQGDSPKPVLSYCNVRGDSRAVPGALGPPRDSLFPWYLLAPGSFSSTPSLSIDFPGMSPKLQEVEGLELGPTSAGRHRRTCDLLLALRRASPPAFQR